ncbi:hypothetical protein MSG28_007278 [Choristoneura fumiferana]|uniref:Uncharacterized protein n=1 Tax=Choristoneura fumiferana TaxID=7141 RepID=A0ACC0JWF4_CHOFU|nr:hypothetical protein MSG28_007278 [Choristoneura fumiferana]
MTSRARFSDGKSRPHGADSKARGTDSKASAATLAAAFSVHRAFRSDKTLTVDLTFYTQVQRMLRDSCSCTQTYVPYLFLVLLPLGPVTLTGQDYVLVESGCVCRPDPSN